MGSKFRSRDLTDDSLKELYHSEALEEATTSTFDHYHHIREVYGTMVANGRFDTREDAKNADRFSGPLRVSGVQRCRLRYRRRGLTPLPAL